MTYEKWLDLKDKISSNFKIEEYKKEPLKNGPDSVSEILIFNGPNGKIKLEWISKPKTLGEKTIYSGRVGADVKVEKVYSQDEKSEFLKVYRFIDDDWQEINPEYSGQNFNF